MKGAEKKIPTKGNPAPGGMECHCCRLNPKRDAKKVFHRTVRRRVKDDIRKELRNDDET